MNSHLLFKIWIFSHKIQNLFLRFLMIILIDVTLKLSLAMQFFKYCLNQLFPEKLSFLLSDSISWQWLLFGLVEARNLQYKQVIKFG